MSLRSSDVTAQPARIDERSDVYAIGALPPIVVGLTLLTQPAISAAIGWVVYGEMLQPLDWIRAFAIAAALVRVRLPARGLKPLPEGTS